MKRLLPLLGLPVLLAIVGCGSSSSSSSTPATSAAPSAATPTTTSSSAPAPAAAPRHVTVALRSSKLGRYLVDGSGRTVYLFLADKGGRSACYGMCAKHWEPLSSSTATSAGAGASSAKVSTIMRKDGITQVVYNGHPLYHYDDDHHPGQMEGQGNKEFGAEWYVLSAAGNKLEAHGS